MKETDHGLTNCVILQGKLYVRGDSKIFRFQNGKTESLFLQRKNPRRIAWTILYRRMHKKGISEVSNHNIRRTKGMRPLERNLTISQWKDGTNELTQHHITGSCQKANPSYSQAPESHRWCFPRCHQGAPRSTTRSPCCRSFRCS